jgi:hypothetical protein
MGWIAKLLSQVLLSKAAATGRMPSARPTAAASRAAGKRKITRDWSLLVSDQDILDLVGTCSADTLYLLAARFVAIHDAIKSNDLAAIERIAKKSRAAAFRKVISGIKRGVASGESWSARHTARAVIAEAFHHTPAYFLALDAFIASLRQNAC